MKPAGKRQKGKRAELAFAKLIRKIDPDAKRMVLSGASYLKGDIYTTIPWHFEIKNQEKVKIWEWWDQCISDCPNNKLPVLGYTSNHRPLMVTLRADDFINLLKEIEDLNKPSKF